MFVLEQCDFCEKEIPELDQAYHHNGTMRQCPHCGEQYNYVREYHYQYQTTKTDPSVRKNRRIRMIDDQINHNTMFSLQNKDKILVLEQRNAEYANRNNEMLKEKKDLEKEKESEKQ